MLKEYCYSLFMNISNYIFYYYINELFYFNNLTNEEKETKLKNREKIYGEFF